MPTEPDVEVLFLSPREPVAELAAMVQAVSPRVRITSGPEYYYQEPTEQRTKRNRNEYVPSDADIPVTPALRAGLAQAHVILGYDLPTDIGALAPNLRWFQAIGAGMGHLKTVTLPPDVLVTNGAGIGAGGMAEFVVWRLLCVLKQGEKLAAMQRDRRWPDSTATTEAFGRSLEGSTILVVGFGAIGRALATRLQGWGVRVIGVRRHPEPSPLAEEVVGVDRLLDVLGEADAVVLSAPGTDETRNMFGATEFAAMQRGAIFCNVARGHMVEESSLVDALVSGQLGAAILDVVPVEPLPQDSPLWTAPNIYLSPHCSPALDRYTHTAFELFARNLRRWLDGEPLENVVDLERGY